MTNGKCRMHGGASTGLPYAALTPMIRDTQARPHAMREKTPYAVKPPPHPGRRQPRPTESPHRHQRGGTT